MFNIWQNEMQTNGRNAQGSPISRLIVDSTIKVFEARAFCIRRVRLRIRNVSLDYGNSFKIWKQKCSKQSWSKKNQSIKNADTTSNRKLAAMDYAQNFKSSFPICRKTCYAYYVPLDRRISKLRVVRLFKTHAIIGSPDFIIEACISGRNEKQHGER